MKALLSFFVGLTLATAARAQVKPLEIYWTDVEGGASTLIVTPDGQSLLVDSGFEGERDPGRILATIKAAGLSKIDILITTHYHGDHVGGAPALAHLIPIGKFYDHGDSIEGDTPAGAALYQAYKAAAEGERVTAKPGERLPLSGVSATLVSADGNVLGKPINGGGPNGYCAGSQQKDADRTENSRSVGFLLTYGKFKFLDMGDLTWDREMMLACPVNKLGKVTVFQASHHGFTNGQSGAPALVWGIQPQVIVVNDGARKGFAGDSFDIMSKVTGIEGIWQLHRSLLTDDARNTREPMIANMDEGASDHGYGLKISVAKDGAFTVMNQRNNFSKSYQAR